VTVEAVLVAPALLALLLLTILAGRVVLAGATIEQVAAAGARAASLARSADEATAAATAAVRRSITGQRLQCQDVSVSVDTTGFRVPLGQPASVAVTVSCRVRLSDLALPAAPGSRILSDRAVSPLDPYRGRVLGWDCPNPSQWKGDGGVRA
jgi:Flp pilus assembly protein TadG